MKILIAEDDDVSRRLLKTYLERWGHEVTEATNGAQALDLIGANDFPIIIADWIMPEVDGLELIRRIRARKTAYYVYIILLTAKTLKQEIVAGIEAGADDFISKPFDRDELRVRVLAGERVLRLERDLARQNQELRDAQAALVQSEKFASIGQLALGVAHELQGPVEEFSNALYHLRGTLLEKEDTAPPADAMSMEPALPKPRGDDQLSLPSLDPATADGSIARGEAGEDGDVFADFGRCVESVEQVRELVRSLRDFARNDEFLMKEVSIPAAIKDVAQMLRSEMAKKGMRLDLHVSPSPPVMGNAGKLKKVIMGVLKNAIEASETGGRIDVRASGCEGGTVTIDISDEGPGIGAEAARHLFEPFFTTKHGAGHAGLGLSISRSIVGEHGGSLEYMQGAARGATFRITLPCAESAGKPEA
ncbi:MAG TPA: response regulator [Tepidisphaeraceae bacterium]|nr:response regulator [Tepidisphaeraceae bacterium]